MSKPAKNIFLLTSDMFTAALYTYTRVGDEKPGRRPGLKKGQGKREKEKKERKIAENFTLIALTVIRLLLSKFISSQTENYIYYRVYFV